MTNNLNQELYWKLYWGFDDLLRNNMNQELG